MIKELKTCVECNKSQGLEYFEFRTDTNKYRPKCRKCNRGYAETRIDKSNKIKKLFEKGLKNCGECKKIKTLKEFNLDKYTSTGYTSQCINCISERTKRYRESEIGKIALLQNKYNSTYEECIDFLTKTECEICSKEVQGSNKNFDHCHATGKYRGLLCGACNKGLGHFRDNEKLLLNAIKYLKNKQLCQVLEK